MRRLFWKLGAVCFLGVVMSGAARAQQGAGGEAGDGSGVTAPAANADGVYRLGHGVVPPKPIYMPDPQFSNEARKKKIAGNCMVALIVNEDGSVRDVHVVRSIAEGKPPKLQKAALSLDEKALETVRQYRFRPAMRDGKPVAVEMRVEVNFQIF